MTAPQGPPPGYGPPPHHGAPGYGPPPGYGYPPPGYPPVWRRPTNTMAILSLVLAFVFAPAGLVLGIIARKQIRRTGEDGAGLALAGIIVGSIATALFVLLFVAMIVAFAAASSYSYGP
jgi:preprotein translocase subunit SecG